MDEDDQSLEQSGVKKQRRKVDIKERFDRHWIPEPFSGCWLWIGVGDGRKFGYGRFQLNGRPRKAHRVSWELHNGVIPKGMGVCHTCDTPMCVNPTHLFLGTQSDNMKDAFAKKRIDRAGDKNPSTKLSRSDIDAILSMRGNRLRSDVASEFGLSASYVWAIWNRGGWKNGQ